MIETAIPYPFTSKGKRKIFANEQKVREHSHLIPDLRKMPEK